MATYVAFLRGMNLGRRRVRNEELAAAFVALGFEDVRTFLASGNVVLRASSPDAAEVAALRSEVERFAAKYLSS